ncbi:unnamed protein product [Schistosoma margrebowiei]|uniref:Uncharacterized protein n=1 Tax=Schistosoma margrebowiei TaxID=48269 RepID=A0A183ME85_9TREM|nr:unnamed protein product [Schistosoma margrebowiei]
MEPGGQRLVHAPFFPSGSWSPYVPLGFLKYNHVHDLFCLINQSNRPLTELSSSSKPQGIYSNVNEQYSFGKDFSQNTKTNINQSNRSQQYNEEFVVISSFLIYGLSLQEPNMVS